MASPRPHQPDNLHPLSRELLENLAGHDEAAEIVIATGAAREQAALVRDWYHHVFAKTTP